MCVCLVFDGTLAAMRCHPVLVGAAMCSN